MVVIICHLFNSSLLFIAIEFMLYMDKYRHLRYYVYNWFHLCCDLHWLKCLCTMEWLWPTKTMACEFVGRVDVGGVFTWGLIVEIHKRERIEWSQPTKIKSTNPKSAQREDNPALVHNREKPISVMYLKKKSTNNNRTQW